MKDNYDRAIQATLKHDNIEQSWYAGGVSEDEDVPLHGLLFRTCPHLTCCLTEYKHGMGDSQFGDCSLLTDLENDDLMPETSSELQELWDEADTKTRTTLLERFAMYNRGLDKEFDRKPAVIEDE